MCVRNSGKRTGRERESGNICNTCCIFCCCCFRETKNLSKLDCPQPSIFSCFSIDERAVRTARELDASAKRKKQEGGRARARFVSFFCVEKSRGCGQSILKFFSEHFDV